MEKVLVMLDALKLSVNTTRLACYLSRITHSKLTGILIESPAAQEEVTMEHTEAAGVVVDSVLVKKAPAGNENIPMKNIAIFQDITEREQVEADLVYTDLSAIDMIHKTRFADLLIIDGNAFNEFDEEAPDSIVKEILQQAECPVVIAPEDFEAIDDVVFCYNGMKSSVFAIKQFMYLFPQFKNKRAKLVNLTADTVSEDDERMMVDWLSYHFMDVEFERLGEDALQAFFTFLRKKKNDFVVMGAYGKGLLTSFFENDPGEEPGTAQVPLFIAHY